LLNAFNSGKTAGKEIMILQLEQIALNYARTSEGEKAREMLKYLKSELEMEMTDENGNKSETGGPGKPRAEEGPAEIASPVQTRELSSPTPQDPNNGTARPRKPTGKQPEMSSPLQMEM